LYLFEDVKLRAEEETTFIELIHEGKRKKEGLLKEKRKFGKIAILSNIDTEGEEIYLLYKEREDVEIAFDAMKNELENDKSYLADDDAVRGYFFISFISLYLYFRILNLLRQRGLVGKMSVGEVLFELSKVYLVYYSDGEKKLSEIPRKAEEINDLLELNLFPKIFGVRVLKKV
jgi:transposase